MTLTVIDVDSWDKKSAEKSDSWLWTNVSVSWFGSVCLHLALGDQRKNVLVLDLPTRLEERNAK